MHSLMHYSSKNNRVDQNQNLKAMAFLLLSLFISSLLSSTSQAFSNLPVTTTPVDSAPSPSADQADCPFSGSPALTPEASPVDVPISSPNQPIGQQQQPTAAATVSGPNQSIGGQQQLPIAAAPVSGPDQSIGGQQQQPTAAAPFSGPNQQQQQLDDNVSEGNDQDLDQEQGQLQPSPNAGVQPAGVPTAGVQPVGVPTAGVQQPVGVVSEGVQPVGDYDQGQIQGQVPGQQALGFGAQPLVDNTPFDSGSSRIGLSLVGYALGMIGFVMA